MTIGKRITSISESGSGYVTNGLVGMWDAEWNDGYKVHSETKHGFANLGSLGSDFDATWESPNWGNNFALFEQEICAYTPTGFIKDVLKGEWTIEAAFLPNSAWYSNYRGVCGNHGAFHVGSGSSLVDQNGPVMCQYENGSYGFSLWKPPSGRCDIIRNGDFTVSSANVNYLSCSASDSICEAKGYFNGSLIKTISTVKNDVVCTHEGQFCIGSAYKSYVNKYDTGRQFRGKIFSVRCYNRYLTSKEILTNYEVDKKRFDTTK